MSKLSKSRIEMTDEKRALLEVLLREEGIESAAPHRISRRKQSAHAPLSFAQQRLWFLDQLMPDNSVYNISEAIKLRGHLDIKILEKSISEVVRRHEILRTSFPMVDGLPTQVVAPAHPVTMRPIDLSGLPEAEQEAEVTRLTNEEAERSFDLQNGPLLRATLLLLNEECHVALFTMHHIICDGRSMAILVREVATLYEEFFQGKPSPLPELPIQYADFAIRQRDFLKGEVLAQHLSYWKQQLAGIPPVLELPADRARPAAQSYRGSNFRSSMKMDENLIAKLKQLTQQEGMTLFMTLLAAFKVLLYRLTGQTDIPVGAAIAARTNAEIEELIGFFVNTLVMRSQLDPSLGFLEAMREERKVVLGAFAHQEIPLEKLVDELSPERSLSYSPLFQVMFDLQIIPMEELKLGEVKISSFEAEFTTSKFDLSFTTAEREYGLALSWEYNTDLFDAATIARMTECFKVLLEGMLIDPTRALCDLPILCEAERRQLLVDWKNAGSDYPDRLFVAQIFAAQAEAKPDAVALIFENERVTYNELNRRANQLAHHLIKLGIGPEASVGVCIERSHEIVVALLAILKAGGVFVPLDPQYPKERLALMMEDSRTQVLLTQLKLENRLPMDALPAEVVRLDRDWNAVSQESDANPQNQAEPDNLAYVIYTSGSTGRPKGVCTSNRALANHLFVVEKQFGICADDITLQFASFSFDVSLEEILSPLMVGGSVAIRGEDIWSPKEFIQKISDWGITVIFPPTAYWHQLVKDSGANQQKSIHNRLRLISNGGDTVLPESCRLWQQSPFSSACLLNAYGPTEATVTATAFVIPLELCDESSLRRIPIGRALENKVIYILDRRENLAPIGVAGELCIGGSLLARGYLNRAELTAERFIPDGFSNEPGARLYKTGDLARYLADGNIEFLGRVDNQVKVRGFRIELGEVESVIGQHPAVIECVVEAREEAPGDKRLVAYVVTGEIEKITGSELRSYMKERVPGYMIPAAFVLLEKMPLTPNDKIDRKALSAIKLSRPELEKDFVAPRTELENLLARMWQKILGIAEVGIHDNFFELGGDSIRGAIFINRLQEKLGAMVYVVALFENPNVAELAAYLTQHYPDASAKVCGLAPEGGDTRIAEKEVVQIKQMPRGGDAKLPLSFAQQRLWFLNQLEPDNAFYNISFAVRLTGNLRVDILEKCVNEIIRRHEVLRTTFAIADSQPTQVIAPELEMSFPITYLNAMSDIEQEAELRRLLNEQAWKPVDLQRGPVLKVSLVQAHEMEHVIMVTMHHIVSDEWSMQVLMREVAALYEAFSQGKPSPLPELPIQYADFAVWQREYLQAEVLDEQLQYWKRQLKGAPPLLELPTDRPRPATQTYKGSIEFLELNERLSEQLKQISRQEGMTLFMTMLAAFKVLLYRLSGQTDISVGTPVAGRTRVELEGLIGFFINTLVMRSEIKGEMSFRQVMRREKKVVLGGFTHQEVPFERIVEEVAPERSLSYSPLFQVAFNFVNVSGQTESETELPELSMTPLKMDVETSKYDLVLVVTEDERFIFMDIRYSIDLFDRSRIKRMMTHFQNLLESAVADPERPVSVLTMLGEDETRQILVERNNTSSPYPKQDCAHHLFERHANIRPDAIALACAGQRLTYAELNERANQMAHYLCGLGVGPETLVGVCMKGSIEMVVATLGILKAGGAYIPLDPNYPKRRLALMLEESAIPVLLTQEELEERLPAHFGQTVFVDSDWEMIEQYDRENPDIHVGAENLAYVIYTSGSTGQPKGVQITHESLLNLICWHLHNFAVTPDDRATQVAAVAFDACVWEIWPYLAAGASLHFPDDSIRTSPLDLRNWLVSSRITISFLPTPLAEGVLSFDWPDGAALRALLTGGDKLHRYPFKPLPFDLINNYGPSENAVVATSGLVPVRPGEAAAPSIGRPIHNTQVYLLDANLQLVPDGVPGQLHVCGSSLARGYLMQPDMTAERFIPNPFANQPGSRIYETGDLARYSSDGDIEFLARIDDQVKLRGFRIELGEIEAALAHHPALQDSLVMARQDKHGANRLVAYLIYKPDYTADINGLRSYLKERLPEYMVPQAFVTLDGFPLTANGKVDRKALPAPDQSRSQVDKAFQAPGDALESFLADKWREVLEIEEVGVHDNFFAIGGESLKAAVLVNKLQQELAEMLQVVSIFDFPTIAEFADYLKRDCATAVSRLLGDGWQQEKSPSLIEKIDSDKVAGLRRLITPLPPRAHAGAAASKNPQAIFVLSSPRSGSTLFRVMLGGHSRLFAPPELELLSFNTLEERRAEFSGRQSFWLEGAIRAIMQIKGCDADEAKNIIEDCEAQKLTTKEFYRLMQEWLAEKRLVDKTPSYAMDMEVLNRAETDFSDALYIHLLRSPQGMIRSYEEAKLDQIFPRFKHPFSAREVAELVWVVSHQNILKFLSRVPESRQHRVRFEDLVKEPEPVTRQICAFLGIEFESDMLRPYNDKQEKMTDGIHTVSRMLGDIKFHQHTRINPDVAESWREYYPSDFLGEATLELAESLGYKSDKMESPLAGSSREAFAPIQPVAIDAGTEQILSNLDKLSDEQLDDMLAEMQDNG